MPSQSIRDTNGQYSAALRSGLEISKHASSVPHDVSVYEDATLISRQRKQAPANGLTTNEACILQSLLL